MSYSRTQKLSVSFEDDGTWELLDDNGNDCVEFVTTSNGKYAPHWEEEGVEDFIEFPTLADALICLIGKELYDAFGAPRRNWNPAMPPRMLTPGA